MFKRRQIFLSFALVLILGISVTLLGVKRTRNSSGKTLVEVVSELRKPNFIATGADIVKKKLTLLKVYIDPLDPENVTNWGSISNCMVIWIDSEVGKRNARYFYDEMRNDKAFDGSTWYSARSPFGEQVTICDVDLKGTVIKRRTQRVDAIGMYLDGFISKGATSGDKGAVTHTPP